MGAFEALTQGSICGASVASMFGDWTGIPTGAAGVVSKDVLEKIRSN
jgi:2-dehydro-3-deoxygluconokinase